MYLFRAPVWSKISNAPKMLGFRSRNFLALLSETSRACYPMPKGTLAEIAHRLGRKALEELSAVAKPDTLLAWYRKLIANKFDGSKFRKSWGRPRVDEESEQLASLHNVADFNGVSAG
jgi:hypothetical protein